MNGSFDAMATPGLSHADMLHDSGLDVERLHATTKLGSRAAGFGVPHRLIVAAVASDPTKHTAVGIAELRVHMK
jgi:hypothetical protein